MRVLSKELLLFVLKLSECQKVVCDNKEVSDLRKKEIKYWSFAFIVAIGFYKDLIIKEPLVLQKFLLYLCFLFIINSVAIRVLFSNLVTFYKPFVVWTWTHFITAPVSSLAKQAIKLVSLLKAH